MLRSMFAGISGLRSHQTMMDVVGNNISNVNTHGYKSTRATFQDAIYQVTRGATAGAEVPPGGGINPMQVGLGSRVAAVDQNFGQGGLQLTGRATDVSIQGEGFFVVGQGDDRFYTRAGAFNWDSAGNLVAPGGEIVMGLQGADPPTDAPLEPMPEDPADLEAIQVDPDILTNMRDISIGGDGHVTGRDESGEEVFLGRIATAMFANTNGLNRIGNSLFTESANSGEAEIGLPNDGVRGALEGGTLEMSNVDLAEEFTNLIMAQRGFQANARTITTSDELLQELVNIKR